MENLDPEMTKDNEVDFDGSSPAHRRRLRPHRTFDGNSPVHRRRLRPNRGPLIGEMIEDMDDANRDATDALLNRAPNEIILPLPFTSRSCESCLYQGKGDFILLNLNAALQHARSHHCGVDVLYSCKKCEKSYKGKHAAQCHVPKCKGPPTGEDKTVICGTCKLAFKTQRGLSQHERLVHPVERNEKREKAATSRPSRKPNKGCGKVWREEELDIMIRLEKSLEGHPHIAMQMLEHIPEKSLKQIRDKRREPTFKALVEQYKATQGDSATAEPHDIRYLSSDSESELRPVPTGLYIPETEEEGTSDQGQFTWQMSPSSQSTGQTSLAQRHSTEFRHLPDLERLAGNGIPPSREDANDREPQVTRMPLVESCSTEYVGNTTTEQEWRTDIISRTLAETPDNLTMSNKCRDLHSRMISILKDISDKQLLVTQTLVDDVYAQVLAQIEPSQATQSSKRARTKGPKTQTSRKRKRKRYIYARTQDLFRKNPNLLARYIREGISWLEDEDSSSLKQEDIKSFYTALWGKTQNITVPFTVTGSGRIARNIGETFQAITARDIKERLAHTRQNTASGPDGIQRKHLTGQDIKELLRILYNLILVSKIQPTAWNANRTILIPKQGKDGSRVENYRPLTIGSLICRTYWGIVDRMLREVINFSPRQEGFVHETGCFNNIHILNETIKAGKNKDGLVAVQLDIAKAFDTIPHKAIDAALKRLGLPSGVRESIIIHIRA